jgi:hypothetical protein
MNNQAQQDNEQKKQLEAALLLALLAWLGRVRRQVRLYQDKFQQLYHVQNDRLSLQNILTKHYNQVQNRFAKRELQRLGIKLDTSEFNNLLNILDLKASTRATEQSGYILKTTQKRLDQFGVDQLRQWETAMKSHFSAVVVNTETQIIAEETKTDTIGFLQSRGYLNAASKIVRSWVTILDGREREAHFEAFGQQQLYGQRFLVGGEYLRYPGDPTGSPENILN